MKSFNKYLLLIVMLLTITTYSQARKEWGFGISIGDPTGLTAKYNVNQINAWNFNLGSSYFGGLRIGADYLWHFNAFNSRYVAMHAGFGGVLGFGTGKSFFYKDRGDLFYIRDRGVGVAVRGIVGIDFYPGSSPFEIYFELGPLLGFIPKTGGALDLALGFRFYP